MTTNKEVVWGAMGFKADARKCYDEIQTLGESYTPQQIVDLARDPNTELHKCFDWNDETAAEKWRVQTARFICCSLKVVVNKEHGEAQKFRLIQNDRTQPAYKPIVFTVRNEDEYSRLMKQAERELDAFRERYSMIVELESVISEINKILNK